MDLDLHSATACNDNSRHLRRLLVVLDIHIEVPNPSLVPTEVFQLYNHHQLLELSLSYGYIAARISLHFAFFVTYNHLSRRARHFEEVLELQVAMASVLVVITRLFVDWPSAASSILQLSAVQLALALPSLASPSLPKLPIMH